MVNGVVYATAGSRRAAIALDAATGELLWVHGEHEGARGAAAPRQLSGRGLAYWTDGKEERILYVTPGYRLIALDAKTGALVPTFGKNGAVDLKLDDDQTILPDLTTGEIGLQSAPVVAKDIDHHRRGVPRRHDAQEHAQQQGLRARLRRAHRQAPVDLPHHSDEGRVRLRHLGERLGRIHRQHRRVDADHRGRATRPGLPAGGIADRRLLRRPSPGQQSVRREPGLRRSEDRPAQVAFPVGAPSAVGHGHFLGAASWPTSTWTAARSRPSRSPPSRASSTCSIA